MGKYKVTLTKTERDELISMINKGSHTSQKFRNVYISFNCDEGEYADKVTNIQMSKVLMVNEPLEVTRYVNVTGRKTKADWTVLITEVG